MRTAAYLAMGLIAISGAAQASTQEQIGSWVLDCPGTKPGAEPCIMRFNKRFLDKAGITGDLEIQAEGKSLVPVIALRGLSPEMLMAAATEAKLKGTSLQESMQALIGLSHMTKEYSPEQIKKLAPVFAFLSAANPASLGGIERAAQGRHALHQSAAVAFTQARAALLADR